VVPQTKFAPEFELTDIAGAKVTLASLKGKITIAEFAGSWSLGLAEARQEFQTLVDHYKDQPVGGLSFAVREKTRDAAIEEYHKKQFSFDLLLDADGVAKSFGVSGYPSYALIGPDGELLAAPTPFQPADTMTGLGDEIDAALSKLNGTPPPPKHVKAATKTDTKSDAKADPKPDQAKAPAPEKPAAGKVAAPPAKPTNVGTKARPVPQPRPGTTPAKPDTDH
jgi:peroxiredoxin